MNGRRTRRTSWWASASGFGLIEVLVALVIIGVAMGAGITAIAGSRNIKERDDTRAFMMELAQQKYEDVRTDYAFLTSCDAKWKTEIPGSWTSCDDASAKVTTVNRDGRIFHIERTIVPRDDLEDQAGSSNPIDAAKMIPNASGDADGRQRDYYEITVSVYIDPGSMSGIGAYADAARFKARLSGRMELMIPSNGKVFFSACAVRRKDRRVATTNCGASVANPAVSGVVMRLTNVRDSSQTFTAAQTSLTGLTTLSVPSGDYKVSAADITAGTWAGATFYRASPPVVHVVDSGIARADVTMIKPDGTTSVCVRLTTSTPMSPDGYYVDETNILYNEAPFRDLTTDADHYGSGSDVFRTQRIGKISHTWNCASKMSDPQGYANDTALSPRLFLGDYEVSIGQNLASMPTGIPGLRIEKIQLDCASGGTVLVNKPYLKSPATLTNLYGDQTIQSPIIAAINGHTSPSYNVKTYMGQDAGSNLAAYRFNYRQASGDHAICIEFRGAPIPIKAPQYQACPGGVPSSTRLYSAAPIGTFPAADVKPWASRDQKVGVASLYGMTTPWQTWNSNNLQLWGPKFQPANCTQAPGSSDVANKIDPFLLAGVLNTKTCYIQVCTYRPRDINSDGNTDYACMLVRSGSPFNREQLIKIIGTQKPTTNPYSRYLVSTSPPNYSGTSETQYRYKLALTPGAAHSLWPTNNLNPGLYKFKMKVTLDFVAWVELGVDCPSVMGPVNDGGTNNLPAFPFAGNYSSAIRATA